MEARMTNPAMVLGAMEPFQALFKAVYAGGVDPATLELVHLRASQINGCSACVDSGARSARKAGETEERLATVAAWREAPYFSDAERAALALAEAATRLADRPDPVPDQVWDAAAAHYDEKGMAALVLMIAVTNLFNRLNATHPPGRGRLGLSRSRPRGAQSPAAVATPRALTRRLAGIPAIVTRPGPAATAQGGGAGSA